MTSNSNGGMITMMSSTMMPTTLSTTHHQNGDVVLQGYYKKLKTMKRKYFVLLAEDDKGPARLEYYDSEKKFKSAKSTKPKRTIHLKNCFNINRRLDTKHDNVIALSTREEVFCMVLDDENEMNKWLKLLLILQRGENIENTSSDTPQPNYEHVWQVQIQRRGLAERNGIVGPYYVCLTTKSLTLIRIRSASSTNTTNLGVTESNQHVDFPLSTIRRYGDSACLFYLEVGRKSILGTGELWMETEDAFIAKNMHKMISSAITANSKSREESLAPMRIRSSSASEASKPILLNRRPTISGNKTINSSPLSESDNTDMSSAASTATNGSTCTVVELNLPPIVNNQIPNSSSSNANSINSQQHSNQHKLQPQSESKPDTDYYLKLAQTPSSSSAYSSSISTTTIRASTLITHTSSNPHYPFTAPYKTYGSQRRHSVSAMSTTISHQRAYSLPIEETYNINNDINHKTTGNGLSCKGQCNILNSNCTQPQPTQLQPSTATCFTLCCCNNNNNGVVVARSNCKARQLQPVHQRTRSLPLTEETAISCINTPTNNSSSVVTTIAGAATAATTINNNGNGFLNSHYCFAHNNNINHNQQPQHHSTMMMHNGSSNNHQQQQQQHQLQLHQNVAGSKLKSQSSTVIHYNNNNNYNNNNKINCSCMCKGSLNNNCHLGGTFMSAMTTRERCDSLPSTRNRTASECSNHSITNPSMPPPRTIPSLNQQSAHRPHSMYNRHSHSPPINTLSPSTGCSESEGSSLSIDEPDSICQSSTPDESGNFGRYYSSRTSGSTNVIPEENDDYTGCCPEANYCHRDNLNNQGSSLNLPIHTTTTPAYDDIDNQDHYMALSPCASSPHSESCSHAASSLGNDLHQKYTAMSTGNHSRSSSLAEDGYMVMFGDTGKSSKKSGGLTSNTSTYSVNSRDPRYNDFHADNIDSRFDDMHTDMEDRPTRTYSVGSRPEYNKRRLPVENVICNQQMDQNRVRAFSVGSRAKYPRRGDEDLLREVMRPNISSSYNNNNIAVEGKGRKSTSAPILVHKSQSSVERMSDLMEIDFSQNSSDRSGSGSVTDSIASPITSTATTVPSLHNQSVPAATATLSSSPGNVRSLHNRTVSNPVAVPFTRPRCGTFGSASSPRKASGYDDVDGINVPGDGYCEMKPGSFNKTTEVGSSGSSSGILSKLSNSPLKSSGILMTSSKQPMGNEKINTSDYLTMSPSNSNSLSSSTSSLLRSTSRNDRSSSTNKLATSAENKQVAMETDSFPSTASGTPEGYMEMSWNKNKVVVNGGNGNWSTQNRSPSMPIDINPKPKSLTQLNTQTSPCVDRSSLFMEEDESHDQVDSHPGASLSRQLSNPKHQQFNFIPASSFSPKDDYNHHKCLVDATSGKIQLLTNTNDKPVPIESKILNTEGIQKLEALSNDYAEMTIGENSSKFNDYADMSSLIAAKSKIQKTEPVENDYVNINPREERVVTSLTAIITPPTTNGLIKPAPKTPQPQTITLKANPLFTRQKSEPRRLPEPTSTQDSEYEMMCPSPLFKPIKVEDHDGDYDGYVPIEYGNNRKLQVNRTNSTNRPKSVEEFSSPSSAISAASSTSTLCGSNSNSSSSASILTAAAATKSLSPTVNGAFKLQHQQTQPELHYAKLDLPPCSTNNSSSNLASPAAVCVTPPVGGGSNSASASPSPISNVTQAPTFMYAKLDFNKIEEMQRK